MAYRLMFMAVLFREGHIVLLSLESTCCKASLFTFTCTELLRSRTIFDVQGSKDANAQSLRMLPLSSNLKATPESGEHRALLRRSYRKNWRRMFKGKILPEA